jgi:TPR repeat protein
MATAAAKSLTPQAEPQSTETSPPEPAPPVAQAEPNAVALSGDELAALVKRGETYLANGDFASARLLLRRAAAAGSADAALSLGATFDPLVIKQLGAIGAEPDIERARKWYEAASKLGSQAASQQLARLADGQR